MRFTTLLFKNLLRRKTRTLLTAFGVAIAVGATVSLLGISEGFERSMVQSLELRGTDIIVTASNVLDQLSSDLDESYGERMLAIPGVKNVAAGLLEVVAYSTESTDISLLLQGWAPGSFLFEDLEMVEGRAFTADDRRKLMIGSTLAKNLGRGVGDKLSLQDAEFEIVGVYHSLSVFENGAATMPLAELQEIMLREGSVTGFNVIVDPAAEGRVDEICAEITALKDDKGRSLGLSAMPTKEYVNQSAHIRMAHGMAWVTSIIAVVVGAIGTLNTMIMSVVERVREISILRAIGWRKSRVVRMIVGESLMISVVGAIVGALAAWALTRWLSAQPMASAFMEGSIAPSVFGWGFLLALLVGLIGGLYPAFRAARLLPAEGLRHD
jgi:putative ABC transport system permease protein